jgi:hypothetical protein
MKKSKLTTKKPSTTLNTLLTTAIIDNFLDETSNFTSHINELNNSSFDIIKNESNILRLDENLSFETINSSCKSPWIMHNAYCLCGFNQTMDWQAANDFCTKINGFILYINNEKEWFSIKCMYVTLIKKI